VSYGDKFSPPTTRLIATSIGSVFVTADLDHFWAVAFDEVGDLRSDVQIESFLDTEEAFTAALIDLGLPEGEAEEYARELCANAEKAHEDWLARLPDRRRRRLTKYYEQWKARQAKFRESR
jgi:hypothetical protein